MLDKSQCGGGGLPLASLNHISFLCRSLEKSVRFYQDVLGFFSVRRPGSFGFDGAWLFNYGIGIHLLQDDRLYDVPVKTEINPKDNHISFQCESLVMVEKRLKEKGIKYEKRRVEEGDVHVEQLFFHDPDAFMIEICNCENLLVVPLAANGEQQMNSACKSVNFVKQQQLQKCHSAAAVHAKEEPHVACT